MTEDEMFGWHHQLDGHEFEHALGVGVGQESLACYSSWVAKSRTRLSDRTELINDIKDTDRMNKYTQMPLF